MLQENPESERVRDQQQRHDESRNDVRRSQLSGHESGMIGLVKSVKEIGCTPDIKDPCDRNTGRAVKLDQREQGEYRRDQVAISCGAREAGRQVR